MYRLLLLLIALGLVPGCTGIRSSVVRTTTSAAAPFRGPVSLRATKPPSDGAELGVVQVTGPRPVDELAPEFKKRVGELGGNIGVVDSVKSAFEMESQSQTYTYSCGTTQAPRSCTGTRTVTVEVMTVQMLGRAFRK